jgi:hypothetical protein
LRAKVSGFAHAGKAAIRTVSINRFRSASLQSAVSVKLSMVRSG